MNTTYYSHSLYQVGGCLSANAPSYVKRKADDELFNWLLKGEFCYVLNSRQMGKSSLRVQTMKRLQDFGITCASIDITAIGTQKITPEKWYGGLTKSLVNSFDLRDKINLRVWWKEREKLPPVQCFGEFIEEVLLREITQNIVIFIDEIDSILRLNFKDNFFALIRACYNKRAENLYYKRLSFVLLGVATPSDLIKDKNRTPFNIGRSVNLNGFQLDESTPLNKGLTKKFRNAKALIKEVLVWTGGQPFLTQKVCQLILDCEVKIPIGEESKWVNNLVKKHIIDNWEKEDDPEHLKTIKERIISNKKRTGRWLGIYQDILQKKSIVADDSPEQIELRLSGLIVKQSNKLKVYNLIYENVFNLEWIKKELANLRPYSEAITAWLVSNRQDKSRLLRGQALQNAKEWATNKSLSDIDYQFFAASQELEKQSTDLALVAEKEVNQILTEYQQTKQQLDIVNQDLIAERTRLKKVTKETETKIDKKEQKINNLEEQYEVALKEIEVVRKLKDKETAKLLDLTNSISIAYDALTKYKNNIEENTEKDSGSLADKQPDHDLALLFISNFSNIKMQFLITKKP